MIARVTRSRCVQRNLQFLAAASSLAIAFSPGMALAQSAAGTNDDGAIVVTAQRRQELSRDVPVTVTTVNAEQLTAANIQTMADLPKIATGVRFDKQGAYVQPVIRGIGNTIAYTSAGNSVGIYVDGFYVPNTLAIDFDFVDVKNIQVLKGPQGTLFGRNSTGGAILVTTGEPEFETKGSVEASYERFDAKKIKGYFTAPLNDKIAFSVEGQFSNGHGFNRNIYNGSLASGGGFDSDARINHPDAYKSWSVRAALKAQLSDSVSLILRYQHADKDDPGAQATATYVGTVNGVAYPFSSGDAVPGAIVATQPGQVSINQLADFHIKTDTVQLTARFDLGSAELTSYTQYRKESLQHRMDSDFSSASIFALSLPEKDEVITQELLLNSKPGGRLQYTAGLFFYSGKNDTDIVFVNPGPTPIYFSGNGSKQRTYAAYADVTYEVMDRLFLTGGLRYSHDEVKRAYGVTTFAPGNYYFAPDYSDNHVTPRVVLRYKPSEQSSIYASFTKGFKSAFADVNRTGVTCGNGWYVCPEDMNAYEIGAKYSTNKLSFELAGFWYDYKNLQNSYYTAGRAFYSNAASSRIKGIEASARFELMKGLEVSAAGTYIDAKYRDYQTAGYFTPILIPDGAGRGRLNFAAFATGTQPANGLQVARTPEFSATFSARYSTELARGKLVLSGNLYHSSTVYFDPAHQFSQKAYDLLAARVQWTDPSDTYTIAVFGDNLLNTQYLTQAYGTQTGAPAVWAKPATYGVSLRINFGAK